MILAPWEVQQIIKRVSVLKGRKGNVPIWCKLLDDKEINIYRLRFKMHNRTCPLWDKVSLHHFD